jgi:hypothetical protein
MIASMLALPLAWLTDLFPPSPSPSAGSDQSNSSDRPRERAGVRVMIESVTTTLATLVAIKIDFFTNVAIWPLIVLALLADDGRWLGAFLGAMLPGGRPALRSMRLVMPAMAAGPTQTALAALALWGGLIADRFALPLLAGAILIEVTAPARRSMASRLIETEEQVDSEA